jgi:biopolymer transport protein TolR
MGMSTGGGGGKGKRRRGIAEINVTPLVDVMLVLLVIFMITAPTMKEGFPVEIPQADATQQVALEDAYQVTVTADGLVLRPGAQAANLKFDKLSELVADLKKYDAEVKGQQKQPTVVIVGDRKADYERIIQVWNAVRTAGILQVSLQVDPGAPADTITTAGAVPAANSTP